MCERANAQALQRGMNYLIDPPYSVVLMSRRTNAPYQDRILGDGQTIEYEGHDVPKTRRDVNPKAIDQPRATPSGRPTQNGLFAQAVEAYKRGDRPPALVRVYEKVLRGVWSDKGLFQLINYKFVSDGKREVFKFYLRTTEEHVDEATRSDLPPPRRLIPSEVKREVWKRDQGRCVLCGATDNLHFDHDIPWSKGGSSMTAQNVRILCARHNIDKRDKIE